ncbi:magnesium/cobalt transporter CorA [Fusibacter bizertensis]|uniref:Magnesium transport protein CorA n=1 Tax=Fusibacter bizertensis TaxID=1488331 RepID=A0ABT6NBG7_9FIRM|nr:magnesium/cobalt transporter CorA [Fusibacter bizertensis]MDH8677765.1 magnesium/cobalt transporter CorA [Fusibacter bizertensis]
MKRTKLNLPPESVIYTGDYPNNMTQIQVFAYDSEHMAYDEFTDIDFESELAELLDSDKNIWINVIGLNQVETIISLGELLGLSPLAIEDIVHVAQRSKIEINAPYLFTILKMVYRSKDRLGNFAGEIVHEHLSIVLTDRAVITFQEKDDDVFDFIRQRLKQGNGRLKSSGADYLYYAIIDALVDHQLEILTGMGDLIDAYDQNILEDEKLELDQLFKLRKQILLMRASVMPFKDILIELNGQQTNEWISSEVKVFLKDVSDHVNHVNDLVALYREMVNNIYEMNMMNTSNQLNQVMSILTIFSAIFIPLNFMTGFFGMNFKYFPGLESTLGIPVFLATAFLIFVGMILFFKKKKWF